MPLHIFLPALLPAGAGFQQELPCRTDLAQFGHQTQLTPCRSKSRCTTLRTLPSGTNQQKPKHRFGLKLTHGEILVSQCSNALGRPTKASADDDTHCVVKQGVRLRNQSIGHILTNLPPVRILHFVRRTARHDGPDRCEPHGIHETTYLHQDSRLFDLICFVRRI